MQVQKNGLHAGLPQLRNIQSCRIQSILNVTSTCDSKLCDDIQGRGTEHLVFFISPVSEKGATTMESPVWTPTGSKFSILQTVMQFPLLSRITSYSISFHPAMQRSTRTCLHVKDEDHSPGFHEFLLHYVRYRRRFHRVCKPDEELPDNQSCPQMQDHLLHVVTTFRLSAQGSPIFSIVSLNS